MRHGKDKTAKEPRAASKKKAAVSRRARSKSKEVQPQEPAAPAVAATTIKLDTDATPKKVVSVETPKPATAPVADRGPSSPAIPFKSVPSTSDRRRWPDRQGPTTSQGDPRRGGPDHRGDGGDGDPAPRANKLMPTNAVHPTERRIKRRVHQNRALIAAGAAALLGVLILSNQSQPPELVLDGRQMASRAPASDDWQNDTTPGTGFAPVPSRSSAHASRTPDSAAPTTTPPSSRYAADADSLTRGEIFEMKQLLARLELSPSEPDGIVDARTRLAIRVYQKFAGLPVDGEPSALLLADMREVVKMMDARN